MWHVLRTFTQLAMLLLKISKAVLVRHHAVELKDVQATASHLDGRRYHSPSNTALSWSVVLTQMYSENIRIKRIRHRKR